jgi:hypothetical protein
MLSIHTPFSWQIHQRTDFDFEFPFAGELPAGSAMVSVTGENDWPTTLEYAIEASGLNHKESELHWLPLPVQWDGNRWSADVEMKGGGWYTLHVRVPGSNGLGASVSPVGVGEVFLIAGQSNASYCHDELQRVSDRDGRVTILDLDTGHWRIADDPETRESGGTFWPMTGDLLLEVLGVPIGFVNVSRASTSVRQWLPGTDLHAQLEHAACALGAFRAVLWQQGESDVIEKSSAADYAARIERIAASLSEKMSQPASWVLAKSTYHPTCYRDPKGEEEIRQGIELLLKRSGFLRGPDTDLLRGQNRGNMTSRRHFSPPGQRRAALMWYATLSTHLLQGTCSIAKWSGRKVALIAPPAKP